MKPTLLLAMLLSTSAALVSTACTTTTADDEADPDLYDVDGKADSGGRYGYFSVTHHEGRAYLERANRARTRCHDGAYRKRCPVQAWDLTALGLDPESEAYMQEDLASGERAAVVRGALRPSGVGGRIQFIATEMWVSRPTAGGPAGELRYVGAEGGCAGLTECPLQGEALNTSRVADVFRLGGAALEELGPQVAFVDAAVRDEGVLVRVSAEPAPGELEVSQVFVPVLPFVLDGCELACDRAQCVEPGAAPAAACDVADEFCETAYGTCGRGADGRCGWQWEPEVDVCRAVQ